MLNRGTASTLVLRNPTRWWLAGFYFLFAVGCLAALALGPFDVKTVICLIGAPAFVVLAIRMLRSSISIDDIGVTARADRFTKHLRWSDIQRFEIRLGRGGAGSGLGARKNDGTWVRLMDRGGLDSKNTYGDAVARLQNELARRHPN